MHWWKKGIPTTVFSWFSVILSYIIQLTPSCLSPLEPTNLFPHQLHDHPLSDAIYLLYHHCIYSTVIVEMLLRFYFIFSRILFGIVSSYFSLHFFSATARCLNRSFNLSLPFDNHHTRHCHFYSLFHFPICMWSRTCDARAYVLFTIQPLASFLSRI